MQKSKVKNTNQNSKLNRDAVAAKRFIARMKSGENIPLRTMLLMKNRMSALHKKIKPLSEFQKLEKDIDVAFLQIARAQVRHERKLKTKKKIRTYGDSMVNRKKKR